MINPGVSLRRRHLYLQIRTQLPAVIVAVLGAWASWQLGLLKAGAPWWRWFGVLVGTLILALVLGLTADYVIAKKSKMLYLAEQYLYMIVQDCAHSRHEEMKSADFGPFLDAAEAPLGKGDHITILTHDLDAYDAIDLAATIIARNISDGCRYEYLIPDTNFAFDQFRRYQLKMKALVTAIGRQTPDELETLLRRNLTFRIMDSSAAIYYFSYIERNARTFAYWYMTTPSADDPPRGKVFYIELGDKNKERLYSSFELIRKASYKKKRKIVPRLRDAWRVMVDNEAS
jgi:hypothetical protein